MICIEPLPRDPDRDVGLVLMISRNDLDRLAQHRVVKIFRGEFCGGDRTGPAEIATAAVVAEHADADHAVGYAGAVLRMERGQSKDRADHK